jgi:uncharacterized protein YdeI (YjbR/CyaY-like superfamily)
MNPIFFANPAEFRRWLTRHHAQETELWVGFHKKASGQPSMTWPESVDEALCFGWIDGIRKSVDAERYVIRFTPRRKDSIWSAVNTKRAQELIDEGRMRPAGREAFAARSEKKTAIYAFEQREALQLDAASTAAFRRNRAAWAAFSAMPPGYRRTAVYWVMSAKRQETRDRRLATLIADSAAGLRIQQLRPTDG